MVIEQADAQARAFNFARPNQLRHGPLDRIHRDGEANPHGNTRRTFDRRRHTDQTAGTVQQGTAGVARIDRRIGLNHPLNWAAGHGFDLSPQAADDAAGKRQIQFERTADGEHFLADFQIVRRSQRNRLELVRRAVHFQHGNIFGFIEADELRLQPSVIGQRDPGTARVLNDMKIRDHMAARRGIRGVLIRRVSPNSAAAKAGLRGTDEAQQTVGDIIVAVDDHEVLNQTDLYRVLDLHEVGDTLRLKVLRDQQTLEVSVTLQALASTAP